MVKNANEAILEAMLKKHDGLETTFLFSDATLRTSLLCIGAQGSKVKKANEAILEAILKKHDGLETTCLFSDATLRTSLIYVMNNRQEHNTRAYLSPIEDSKASNVLPSNHQGCSRLE
ncbi:hypothetical protein Tco_1296774, partial [Tanacetum coccineum]